MKKLLPVLLALAAALALLIPATAAGEFTDVPEDAPYAQAVAWCRENQIMSGTSDTTFSPDSPLTRGMLVVILHRAEHSPAAANAPRFADVPDGTWYTEAVSWAAEQGLVLGYGDGRFGPNDPITRGQLAAILRQYGGEEGAVGVDTASPGEPATRAEAAVALHACLTRQSAAPEEGPRVLVAYFSATGTTEAAAEQIREAVNGDLFEIVPAVPYTGADLNYSNSGCRANREQREDGARPAIAPDRVVDGMDRYDVVFLGYPLWWGVPPKIICTFLESYDFDGKTIVPFCTSGGSPFSADGLAGSAPGALWAEGRRLNGASREAVERWIDSLDLEGKEDTSMTMVVRSGGTEITFALNDSPAARSLLEQLPLTVEIQPFSTNEQTFYPPQALDITGTPAITSAEAGTLAYYAPWKDVVLFYEGFSGGGGGLYELGKAVEGGQAIRGLSGTVTISRG